MVLEVKKQFIAVVYLIVLSVGTILSLYIPKNEVTAKEEMIIPNDAIRLRILANSDSESDQALKREVRDAVNKEITKWVSNLTSKQEARELLQAKLPEIEKIAKQVIEEQQSSQTVKVEFDKVQFPTKLYGQFLYPAGKYDAILITLGKGKGANWWCVLYPPLCFLDFSNGVAVSEGHDEKEPVQNELKEKQLEKEVVGQNLKEDDKNSKKKVPTEVKQDKTNPPVYTEKDEQPVRVKFLIVELWKSIF